MQVATLDQLADVMRSYPFIGIITRSEFEKFQIGGNRIEYNGLVIIASHNYRCLNAYSKDQSVQLDGMSLTVYVDSHRQEGGVARDPDLLWADVTGLAVKARAQCGHENSRELTVAQCRARGIRYAGACWHVYECLDCNKTYSVDSSG